MVEALQVLRHLLGNQMLPETIRLADRPLEPKDVDSFPVLVMLSTGDDGEPILDGKNIVTPRMG